MEKINTNANTMASPAPGFEACRQLTQRSEVIDRLSRTPVKVRRWLMAHETFRAGLESLDPSSPAWVQEEKVRSLIKNGLVRMIDSASEFFFAFPDAQIPAL